MLALHPSWVALTVSWFSFRQNGVPSNPKGLVLENLAQNAPFNL
jgi:hypothetical protein